MIRPWPPAPFFLAALTLATIGTADAQTPRIDSDNLKLRPPAVQVGPVLDLSQTLPLDPTVRTGTLPNGMTYYIQKNGWPENRVSLRLAINAGSVLETDDQQGFAHFLEHMCFNGSKHFEPGELVKYLESIGARFGADANAYTSFDETVYMLDLPADNDSLEIKGLWAMGDYAARARLSDREIEKERGVVLDEWRRGRGAQARLSDKHFPIIFSGSQYATRLPIGKPEVIERGNATRIRDFYSQWYRPERMAIIAVGTLDPDSMLAMIQAEFADIPKSASLPPLPVHDIPGHGDLKISVATDSEARFTLGNLYFKQPRTLMTTLGDYRDQLTDYLVYSMLNDRLDEQGRRGDAKFLSASVGGGSFVRTMEVFSLSVRTEDGLLEPGFEAALVELKRAGQHGFGQAELDRARESQLAEIERLYQEKNRMESQIFAGAYVSHYLDQEPTPGIENEVAWSRSLLPGIAVEDVNGALTRMMATDSRVLTVSAPEKAGLAPPDEAALRAAIERAWQSPVEAWVDAVADRPLLAAPPPPGTVTNSRTIPELGATVITLSNGVEVWMKPTDFKNDQIIFSSYAKGGASIADPEDYPEAIRASSIIGEQGIGGFKPVELEKLLAGKLVGGSPYVGSYSHGLSGSSTPGDLETALQLVYLTFTQPTDRPEAFDVLRKKWHSDMENRLNDPDAQFGDAFSKINSNDHYMSKPLTADDVDHLEFDKAVRFYRQRFANAADFTFFFVGSFDPAVLTPLVARYIGGLPSTGKKTSAPVNRKQSFPMGVQTADVTKGVEAKSRSTITFYSPTGIDEMAMYRARMAGNILRRRLREILREELGTTYSVGVSFSNPSLVSDYGTITVSYSSAPENANRMADTTLAVVKALRAHGPKQEEIASLQELERRELETSEKQNAYWLGSLQLVHQMGFDPLRVAKRRERIDLLTAESLHEAFKTYLPVDRWTRVTLWPEQTVETGSVKPVKP
ncbi:MAG: insulinase family protein [Candidatus Eisenbacteria bacterium]|nr:insulinase family protein [Candidatus Eisenbacteria bacterium]